MIRNVLLPRRPLHQVGVRLISHFAVLNASHRDDLTPKSRASSTLSDMPKWWLQELVPSGQKIEGTGANGNVLKRDLIEWLHNNMDLGKQPPIRELTASLLQVGGLDDVVAELNQRVFLPLVAAPAAATRLGVTPPKGIMMHGPPGCGKSLLATRLANVLEPSRPPRIIRGPELLSVHWGADESQVRELFEAPRCGLQVVILDEADVILQRRGSEYQKNIDRIVAQFLSCMDGASTRLEEKAASPRGRVLFIATTNQIEAIDPALLRPGRFSLSLPFPPLDVEGRLDILRYETASLRTADPTAMAMGAEKFLDDCAGLTGGFSGADLAGLVDEAKMKAMHRVMHHEGDPDAEKVTMLSEDLFCALDVELKRRGEESRRFILSKAHSKYSKRT